MNLNARPTHPAITAELLRRAASDQAARRSLLENGEPGDLLRIDAENATWLKAVVAEHGWPGFTLVGEEGADAAWLLVQHADRDPGFQCEARDLLQAAVDAGEAPSRHLAYLTDRVLVNSGRPQLYGTQYTGHDADSLRPHPVQDPEHLDERRAGVGLEPAAAYGRRLRARYVPAEKEDPA
ncbi:DUF6624 domain-containing protein [Streptomyces sp. NPDC029216]|uniref:DUF6624 domain-containing protein n=1 Tax=Streptomyces sp. NPDC029216 TaxID=3154701 RepID=UPI0033E20EEE